MFRVAARRLSSSLSSSSRLPSAASSAVLSYPPSSSHRDHHHPRSDLSLFFMPHRGLFTGLCWVPIVDGRPSYVNPVRDYDAELLFSGADHSSWFIILDDCIFSSDDCERKLRNYIELLAQVVGSEEEAARRIYCGVFKDYSAFGCKIKQEDAEILEGLPEVLIAVPDFFLLPKEKDYGGEKIVGGRIVCRSPADQKVIDDLTNNPKSEMEKKWRLKFNLLPESL